MKINFTKNQYRALVDLLGMADWVVGAHSVEADEKAEKYEALIQHIFSFSKDMGCTDLVEYSKDMNGYGFTQQAEENSDSRHYIEKFERDNFWESLVANLAERDLNNMPNRADMTEDEYYTELYKLQAKWAKEFETNGLDRVFV